MKLVWWSLAVLWIAGAVITGTAGNWAMVGFHLYGFFTSYALFWFMDERQTYRRLEEMLNDEQYIDRTVVRVLGGRDI
jgi:membrane protein implicated in regulation of membrane protease activity